MIELHNPELTPTESMFISGFASMQNRVYSTAVEHGWWEDENPNKLEKLMLMVSELGEACEWIRKGDPASDHIPSFTGSVEELADVIIRIMDYSEYFGVLLAYAIVAKARFNDTRPYRHGGKTA